MTPEARKRAIEAMIDNQVVDGLEKTYPWPFRSRYVRKYRDHRSCSPPWAALLGINPGIAYNYKVLWTLVMDKQLPGSDWMNLDERSQHFVLGNAHAILMEVDGKVWWEEESLDLTQGPE